MTPPASGPANHSLMWRLAGGLVLVSILAVVMSALLLWYEFEGANKRVREQSQLGQTRLIEQSLISDGHGLPTLSGAVVGSLDDAAIRFALVDADNHVLISSKPDDEPLTPVSHRHTRVFFIIQGDDGFGVLYGLSRRVIFKDRPVWIQVASRDEEMQIETLIEEFLDHLAWIWLPFALILLLVNWGILRFSLRPLHLASAGATAIGPEHLSARLPETGMPVEILPLVRAVNQALVRLEAGYDAQRAFIADAAHELRTPLAVLKAHLAVMPQGGSALAADVTAMERLVNQLLDLARLDVLLVGGETTDLSALAVDVATQLAPLAVRSRRELAVEGADAPLFVQGVYDFLYRALRNLVENALSHTPPGTMVTLTVGRDGQGAFVKVADHGPGVPEAARETIFHRFWRGDRDRAETTGAGLGLSIVARTMAAHGGNVSVSDEPGGGACFILRWPVTGSLSGG